MRFFLFISLFILFGPAVASAQIVYGTGSHTVRVSVATITAVQVSAGTVNMSIAGGNAVAGQDLMSTTDQTTSLLWGINSSLKKITVNTNNSAPQFTLKILAISPTQGNAAPEVSVALAASDFLVNVGRSSGSCTLRYTGEALASQGFGTDNHTITFTILNQ